MRKVPVASTPHFTVELPFHSFEGFVRSYNQMQTQPLDTRGGESWSLSMTGVHYDRAPNREMLKRLQAMVPNAITLDTISNCSLIRNPQPQPSYTLFIRDILYSLSNHTLRLDNCPQETMELFRRYIGGNMKQIIHCLDRTPDSYTVQTITLSLFTALIEIGDSDSLGYLLNSSILGIHANKPIKSDDDSCSPLYRAIKLGNAEVVRVLLGHGAEVNVDLPGHNCYALDAFAKQYSLLEDGGSGLEIFTMLLNAGGKCTLSGVIAFANRFPNHPYAREIIESRAIMDDFQYFEPYRLHSIFRSQDHETCLQLLIFMREHDFDFDSYCENGNTPILDTCVFSDSLYFVELFLNDGAKFTRDAILHAILRADEAILELLLSHKDRAIENALGNPPLVEAIRTKSTAIINLVINHYGLSKIDDGGSRISMSKVGDAAWIEELLSALDITNQWNLNVVLVFAIQTGRNELAFRLIDAMVYPVSGEPLIIALQQRNLGLLRALLDAGTVFEQDESQEAIDLAVEWGDGQVVLDILEATATRFYGNTQAILALISAIGRKDKDMVNLLFEYGVDIDFEMTGGKDSALNEAVRIGDINWIEYILEHGANLHNPSAFATAMRDENIFELLLRKHTCRYPKGRRDWGQDIFEDIMDKGAYDTFKRILERGASPLLHFKFGDSAFAYAITHSHMIGCKYVELLLDWKEKTNCSPETIVAVDYFGFSGLKEKRRTAFEVAIGTGYRPTIDIFLRHGANVNFPAVRWRTRTPLQAAVEHGNIEIVKLLLSCGADVNGPAARVGGATALQLAAITGNIPVCQLLMEHGADIHAPASKRDGRMPLEGAAEHGRLDMVAFLLAAGAGHKGEDREQFERAISFANTEGYGYIADMLTRYLEDGKVHMASKSPLDEFFDFDGMVED